LFHICRSGGAAALSVLKQAETAAKQALVGKLKGLRASLLISLLYMASIQDAFLFPFYRIQ
jgi:hypothetical protein